MARFFGQFYRVGRCLVVPALLAAAPLLPQACGRANAGAAPFNTGQASASQAPALGCFTSTGCDFFFNLGPDITVHCDWYAYPWAVDTSSAGGYTDSGTLCGDYQVPNGSGGYQTFFCGYDTIGAGCETM